MSLHNNILKSINFHNIKNDFWNYFNFSLDLNQNLIFFSSEKNLFENFKILFEKNKKYQGFITYNDQIFNPKKNKVYSDFLTKESFDKIKHNLVVDTLLPLWENQKISANNKKHIKELSEYISLEIYKFLKNLISYLNFIDVQTVSNEELSKKLSQIKNKYKFLHKRIFSFYSKKQQIWNNDSNKSNILFAKIKELEVFFLNKIKNKNNFTLVYKSITKNIIDIIDNSKELLKQENNLEKKNILFLIELYSLFLKNIWEHEEFFTHFNSSQIIYLYKKFQKWVLKLLEKSDFGNYNKVEILFKQTFYSFFINFFQKNKQNFSNTKNKNEEKQNNSYSKNIPFIKVDDKLSNHDIYYENIKANFLRLEKANLLWQKDKIQINLKYSNWSIPLFLKSKKIIWQVNQILKNIKNNNSENYNFIIFLNYIMKDLNLFFNIFDKNKLNEFLNKTLFYDFCFKNKINFNFLFTKNEDLNIDELFEIELVKIKIGNFDLFLLNSDTFFFNEDFKNSLIDIFFTSINSDSNNSQLFLFEKKPVQFKSNFSAIFIEKGTLIEFKKNVEKQPKFNTFFANYFFNNGNFYTNELSNIKKNSFFPIGLNQIKKNGDDMFNTFEKKRLQWISFEDLSENIDINIMDKSAIDVQVIKV